MKNIFINVNLNDIRAAITEDEHLVEYFVEKSVKSLAGNIYLGRVVNVLPGMQAAFVDIGVEKNAFIYINDAMPPNKENTETDIKKVLKINQKILVQVQKESFGNKGPRVTTHISLPGRFLVYMPNTNYVGVSRKIIDEEERNYFKDLGEKIKKNNEGLIIRTVTAEANEEVILEDLQFLRSLWRSLIDDLDTKNPPSLIYMDLSLIPRLIRDLFSDEVRNLVIDDSSEFKRVKEIIETYDSELSDRLHLYSGKNHIFDAYNIQPEIDKITKRKVWLKNGGYIIIDRTEALTAIDVNTGKFIGKSNLEDTVLKTNIEAAIEIAKQLRLRDIGGIIIIDFIDMEEETHGQLVLDVLEKEMKKDRTKSNIFGITQLGLVEMTRKKVRKSLDNILMETCPVCEGLGRVLSEEELIYKIEREIANLKEHTSITSFTLELHPRIEAYLKENKENFKRLQTVSGKIINLKVSDNLSINNYNIIFN